jgi:TetR/AcrR family transcriptional regulator, mexJK operon transcriptional repressor
MAQVLDAARSIFARRGYRATTMDEVAAAAGVTKRTLYAWHADKAALFRACVLLGAERFPRITPMPDTQLSAALEHYVAELHTELVREDSYGMGTVFLREANDFPELAVSIQNAFEEFLINPLAAFLREHRLEQEGSTENTILFVAMALAPLHNAMLVGAPLPDAKMLARHAKRCVAIFISGGSAP